MILLGLAAHHLMSSHWQGDPTDLLWCKNVTSLTRGPNWPPLVQKRYVTHAGPQLTSFGAKMSRHQRGAPTDLLDVKMDPFWLQIVVIDHFFVNLANCHSSQLYFCKLFFIVSDRWWGWSGCFRWAGWQHWPIPHICHESHENSRVNFFWPV